MSILIVIFFVYYQLSYAGMYCLSTFYSLSHCVPVFDSLRIWIITEHQWTMTMAVFVLSMFSPAMNIVRFASYIIQTVLIITPVLKHPCLGRNLCCHPIRTIGRMLDSFRDRSVTICLVSGQCFNGNVANMHGQLLVYSIIPSFPLICNESSWGDHSSHICSYGFCCSWINSLEDDLYFQSG